MRSTWMWLGGGALVLALLVAGFVAVPRVLHPDPCDTALPFASELGLQLSDDDEVVSCDWHSSFPDSSGTVMARTASHATREDLVERSGVSEETYDWLVTGEHSPPYEVTRRPNLERSEQVFKASAPNGHQLKITYDEAVESGLLLTVQALQV